MNYNINNSITLILSTFSKAILARKYVFEPAHGNYFPTHTSKESAARYWDFALTYFAGY
jgi:hypothetical protein